MNSLSYLIVRGQYKVKIVCRKWIPKELLGNMVVPNLYWLPKLFTTHILLEKSIVWNFNQYFHIMVDLLLCMIKLDDHITNLGTHYLHLTLNLWLNLIFVVRYLDMKWNIRILFFGSQCWLWWIMSNQKYQNSNQMTNYEKKKAM